MDHDQLGPARDRDPGRVVEHPDGAAVLRAAVGISRKGRERSVHRERDVGRAGGLAETLRELALHPETGLEVDLAGREAVFDDEPDRFLRRFAAGEAGRADADHDRSLRAGVASTTGAAG